MRGDCSELLFGGDENILNLTAAVICEYTKSYWIIHFKG